MTKGYDLNELYELRNSFTIIALTGRTGSGCTSVAKLLEKGFESKDYPDPSSLDLSHNSYKKYDIVYKYSKLNFKKYNLISYVKVLTLSILNESYESFIKFLESKELRDEINMFNKRINKEEKCLDNDYSYCLDIFKNNTEISNKFNLLYNRIKKINFSDFKRDESSKELYDVFFGDEFKEVYEGLNNTLKIKPSLHNFLFQLISNNLRKNGNPFNSKDYNTENIFFIALRLNAIIKSIRFHNKENHLPTKVVIDSIRNPFEVMFFKQRYSAFYLMAVNKREDNRENDLKKDYHDYIKLEALLEIEYIGGKGKMFFKQYVRDCLEKSDIHISFRTKEEVDEINKKIIDDKENTSPAFTWQMQILKYVSLINHPGIVTPSPEERSMQMAYTAKYNSGCISRQVGAAITDENYSVKAVGWNNTPEGQVPCLLRDSDRLVEYYNTGNSEINIPNLDSFTPFEKTDSKFRDVLLNEFQINRNANDNLLNGRHACFCFKTIHNACYDGKNQVQTRSLHAEESAFLQITKYGGNGIKGGKLFTTASPCELCSKKAYQLGIKLIYYIDPYPGISEKQILKAGSKCPEIRLFNGAIGKAYHWLYEPLMPYKDELSILLNIDIKDLASKQKNEIIELKKEIERMKSEK
jgi:deoxycytidylate deaminase